MSADCTIQDVFNRFYPEYTKTHELSAAQRKVAYHIRNCKTGAFGINVSIIASASRKTMQIFAPHFLYIFRSTPIPPILRSFL